MSQTKRSATIGINEGAEILGVTPKTIRRYIAAGKLPAYRVGPRVIRLELADLEALLTPIHGGAA